MELWLRSLKLSPKSRVHIRGVIWQLWDFAMWRRDGPTQRNPMELVTIKGATKRKKPHSLSGNEFRKFVAHLEEPISDPRADFGIVWASHQRVPSAEVV